MEKSWKVGRELEGSWKGVEREVKARRKKGGRDVEGGPFVASDIMTIFAPGLNI